MRNNTCKSDDKYMIRKRQKWLKKKYKENIVNCSVRCKTLKKKGKMKNRQRI